MSKHNSNYRQISNEKIEEIYDYHISNNSTIIKTAQHYNLNERTLRKYFDLLKKGELTKNKKIGIKKKSDFKKSIIGLFYLVLKGENLRTNTEKRGLNYQYYYKQIVRYNAYPLADPLTKRRSYHKLMIKQIVKKLS